MGKEKKRKKIVVDTNAIISALGWGGHPDEVIQKVAKGELTLYVSSEIINEIIEVMNYPKFNFSLQKKQKLMSIIEHKAIIVNPSERIQVIKDDPTDNIFLECAIEARANFLISGDKHLLALGKFRFVNIVTPADFLQGER
ncbi:putative toxin-antitoxin system toxin component, PIN family [bacterium]|nr:putative toxin-antitoxin system toxin component, PIN family [bacterium]